MVLTYTVVAIKWQYIRLGCKRDIKVPTMIEEVHAFLSPIHFGKTIFQGRYTMEDFFPYFVGVNIIGRAPWSGVPYLAETTLMQMFTAWLKDQGYFYSAEHVLEW